ncbi:PREDICTED: uncharacterized protein LOC108692576 [Atta colombica]|uniref:uncharacterized protein LOC108692576 n=1 Tax=Atta colombica TaxID=520822 RepID=UPI00084C8FF6|nr:PREDICTED: uncharacterized protein LOC108692576 [Atta colombica]
MRTIGIYVVIIAIIFVLRIRGTIDVNLSELVYLAAQLSPVECRRLIAALHYTTYDLPSSLAEAERKVDEEIPCLRLLLHWNNSPEEGRGKTHAAIVHRLRQLNRNDLADWLGKTTFKQLGKDLDNAITLSFDELAEEEMETSTSAFHIANYTQSCAKHDQNILYKMQNSHKIYLICKV